MTLVLPNPNSPQNGQPLDATVVYQNQTAIAQAIQSFDATQIQAGTLNSAAAFSVALNPVTRTKESLSNFVVKGGVVWSLVSGFNGTMSSGTVYVNGIRVPVNSVGSKTFTASQDTYVDIDVNGNVSYVPVANGATTGMPLTANSVRIAKIITTASTIGSIVQYGVDPLGNYIYPKGGTNSSNIVTGNIFYASNATQQQFTAQGNYISATWANAPAGDLIFTCTTAMTPNAGNANSLLVFTGSPTPNVSQITTLGVHSSDGDYVINKYVHRVNQAYVTAWPGGSLTVSLQVNPDTSAAVTFGNGSDSRWGSTITGVLAIGA